MLQSVHVIRVCREGSQAFRFSVGAYPWAPRMSVVVKSLAEVELGSNHEQTLDRETEWLSH